MDSERFAKLTERQRECLRLVFQRHQSKEIAPLLGIEPGTVDQYLKSAVRLLGAKNRRDAALMLAQYEARSCQPLECQPPEIAGAENRAAQPTPGGDGPASGLSMREEQIPYRVLLPSSEAFPAPRPERVGRRNDLRTWERVGLMFVIAIGLTIGFGALLAGLQALDQLTRPSARSNR